LDEAELVFRFIRASGPGGQHVNTSSTAVQLEFDAETSPSLSPEVRSRLRTIAGRRMTEDGRILIDAREHRSQERNRQAAIERLVAMVREASRAPKRRKKTGPSRAARARRLEKKRQRSSIKKMRGNVDRNSY